MGIQNKDKRSKAPAVEKATWVKGRLKSHGIDCISYPTQYAGHASELVQEAIADDVCDLIIAMGGDGTINEVVNTLAQYDTPLAVIPAGTANIFSFSLNIPFHLQEACDLISMGSDGGSIATVLKCT